MRTQDPADDPTAPDAALLGRFAATGDQRAFAVLVERYGGLVLGVCRRTAEHPQDAEDAFQATFLVLARKAAAIRRREALGPWLYAVAVRVGRKARQARARLRAREGPLADVHPAGSLREEADDLRPVLDDALGRLPARFRQPVVLCYLQGQTAEAAAQALGCPRGTVLSRLARARARLRELLARRGVALAAAAVPAALAARAAAAVPLPLAFTTIQSATPAAAGTGSAAAAALAKGVLLSMRIASVIRLTALAAVLAATAGAGLFAARARADRPPAPAAKAPSLDGTWQVTAVVKNGKADPAVPENVRLVFREGAFVLKHGGAEMKGTFRADPGQTPAALDLEVTDGADAGDSQLGIYELDGDTLRICTAHKGVDRPAKFESAEGSGVALITLKRVKE